MAGEATTIARPYAEAVFARAEETDSLELWADMLDLLAAVVRDPSMAALIANPKLDKPQMTELLLEIGGGRLSEEGRNLVRLLVENDRLVVLPEIASLYRQLKNTHEGVLDVHVTAAYPLEPAEEQRLAAGLQQRLGREIRITSDQDPELIGGVRVRAGDLVLDASVAGRLTQLANELGI